MYTPDDIKDLDRRSRFLHLHETTTATFSDVNLMYLVGVRIPGTAWSIHKNWRWEHDYQ